jgi:hypothetical protein
MHPYCGGGDHRWLRGLSADGSRLGGQMADLQHRIGPRQEHRRLGGARDELHSGIGLALVDFEAQRELPVRRYRLSGLRLQGHGRQHQ